MERIYYFHQEVSGGRYPGAGQIAGRFEVSISTAHRDIAYLRDRLNAPLVYDRRKKGYFYEKKGFSLPLEKSPAALFLFALVNRLAKESGLIDDPEIYRLQKELGTLYCADAQKLADKIHYERVEVEHVAPEVIRSVLMAFHGDCRLVFDYSKIGEQSCARKVDPLRLVIYQGRWYLLGYCHVRKAMRMFHLARAKNLAVCPEACTAEDAEADQYLKGSFGIFKGEPVYNVQVLFVGQAADIVRNQVWHRDQVMEDTGDGLVLSVPVADFTEIKMKILQYGWRARVLGPPELQNDMASEVRRMACGLEIDL
jgi:predicted DNA-binding transcriptional regulator YafY